MLKKIATTIALALVLAGASLTFVSDASAASAEQNWFDRATNGGAGHHTGDTNAF
jgi:hypothetical protein